MKLGLIGLGRWGQNYVRTIRNCSGLQLRRAAGRVHQSSVLVNDSLTDFTSDWRDVSDDTSLDGVIVATPPHAHYEIVRRTLDAGLPVMVEKPFTVSSQECGELFDHAEQRGVLCMVNFIHIYSQGYQHLKSCLGATAGIRHVFTENFAPGPYRTDTPVLWDWGSHDVAMCIDLLGEKPSRVEIAACFSLTCNPLGQLFTVILSFPSGVRATCTFGNGAGFKRRCFAVVHDDGCLVYDGFGDGLTMQFSENKKHGSEEGFIRQPSPLECSLNEFSRCILLGEKSHPSLQLAVSVHVALEAANQYSS